MSDVIIKASRIKDLVKEMNVAAEVAPALNKLVIEVLEKAVERAKANGRRTIQARDL